MHPRSRALRQCLRRQLNTARPYRVDLPRQHRQQPLRDRQLHRRSRQSHTSRTGPRPNRSPIGTRNLHRSRRILHNSQRFSSRGTAGSSREFLHSKAPSIDKGTTMSVQQHPSRTIRGRMCKPTTFSQVNMAQEARSVPSHLRISAKCLALHSNRPCSSRQ